MLRALLEEVIDLIVPARGSERLVRVLHIDELRAIHGEDGLPYGDPRVTALIWELKYYANRRAAALAGELLFEHILSAAAEEVGAPLLIPIPMHKTRRRERGHNHTEILCRAALPFLKGSVEYAPSALVRVRATPTQQGLPRSARLQNVRGSMEAAGVADRACIVVDDVSTTGATLEEAKRALRESGARSVHAISLARS